MKTRLRHSLALATAMPLLVGAGLTPLVASAGSTNGHADRWLPLTIDGHPPRKPSSAWWMRAHGAASQTVSVYVVLEGRPVFEVVNDAGPRPREERVAIAQRHLATLTSQHRDLALQIQALGGVVNADLMRATNALQVRIAADRLDRVARLPGVQRLDPVSRYERSLASAVPFVGADRLWNAAGVAATGKGVRVGIVDTGIDYTHADFGGPGDPQAYKDNDSTIVEPGTFPTEKVVGGHDFVGDDYTGANSAVPDPDPLDCWREQQPYIAGGHGSHVAGIAAGTGVNLDGTSYAGPYEASLSPSTFKVSPGVAPEASLYALRVFGCDGSTDMVAAAFDWAMDPDGDGDFTDRLDVVNLSLGGGYGFSNETEAQLVRNVTAAGTLLVMAAGNDGDTFFVTGEPATYTEALSVAATTDQISFLSMKVESPASVAGEVACVEGSFTLPLSDSGPISGVLQKTIPADGCSTLTNAAALVGKIAVIDRGDCYFADKISRAAEAGALAAVVVNNSSESPFSMGGDGSVSTIPGVMISQANGTALGGVQNVTVTLDSANVVQNDDDADEMAVFSSRGPRATDGLLKPDVAAPGVAIDSAGVASGSQPRQMDGTSMACPMVTGAAALLREVHPKRTPLDIKTMLMNTTAPLADRAGNPTPVSLAGAGRIRVDEAAGRDVLMAAAQPEGAVSVSFGAVVTSEPVTRTREVVVTNLGTEDKTFDLSIAPTYALDGVDVTVSPTSVTVPAGQSSTVMVSLEVRPAELPVEQPDPHTPPRVSLGPGQDYARHFATEAGGRVVLQESGADASTTLSVPFHAIVRAADRRAANPARSCRTVPTSSVLIPIEGETTHREPVTSAFQLAATHPVNTVGLPSITDLAAVGVATNTATAETFADASVYFAVAVAGEWTTPARGPLSVVGIRIDTDNDGTEDYRVSAEPLSTYYFADVLAVATYDSQSNQMVSLRFLNLFPRDQLNTEPFNNSVVVLPVSLGELNITEANASFRFRAVTQTTSMFGGEATDWIEYDPTRPAIDTAVGGQDGTPFYPAPQPVAVQLNPDNFEGSPPQVLLLHHSNELGMRFETVDLTALADADPTDLTIDQQAPSSANAGAPANVTWTVSNAGDATAYDVSVSGTISGASAFTVETPQGSCEVGEDVRCSLGDLEPGASVTLTVGIVTNSASVDIDASVQDGLSCETNTDNNQVAATIVVEGDGGTDPDASNAGPSLSIDEFEAGGGCNCGVAGEPSKHQGKGLLAVLVGLGWLAFGTRRRRKES